MKKAAFRLILLVTELFRTAAPVHRPVDSQTGLDKDPPGKVPGGPQAREVRASDVWMESWKVRPY